MIKKFNEFVNEGMMSKLWRELDGTETRKEELNGANHDGVKDEFIQLYDELYIIIIESPDKYVEFDDTDDLVDIVYISYGEECDGAIYGVGVEKDGRLYFWLGNNLYVYLNGTHVVSVNEDDLIDTVKKYA